MNLPPKIIEAINAIVESQIKMPIGACAATRSKVNQARLVLKKTLIEKYKIELAKQPQ